jgi:hypothetical protein
MTYSSGLKLSDHFLDQIRGDLSQLRLIGGEIKKSLRRRAKSNPIAVTSITTTLNIAAYIVIRPTMRNDCVRAFW